MERDGATPHINIDMRDGSTDSAVAPDMRDKLSGHLQTGPSHMCHFEELAAVFKDRSMPGSDPGFAPLIELT